MSFSLSTFSCFFESKDLFNMNKELHIYVLDAYNIASMFINPSILGVLLCPVHYKMCEMFVI